MRRAAAFQDAVRLHAEANRRAARNNDPYFAKYIGDVGNILIESAALYHHLACEVEGQGTGATLGKLQMLAFVHGFASPRRVTMYVKRMVQIGRLSYSAGVKDRRVRRLIPSDALAETARRQIHDHLRAADLAWPGQGLAALAQRDGAFLDQVFVNQVRKYIAGADPLRPFSDVRHFTSKDAGTFLLYAMIHACMEGREALLPDKEFSLSYSEAAQNNGVSRTHVRNVFEAAETRGLLSGLSEGGRTMAMTAKMVTSFESYFACQLLLTRAAALDALNSGPASGA